MMVQTTMLTGCRRFYYGFTVSDQENTERDHHQKTRQNHRNKTLLVVTWALRQQLQHPNHTLPGEF